MKVDLTRWVMVGAGALVALAAVIGYERGSANRGGVIIETVPVRPMVSATTEANEIPAATGGESSHPLPLLDSTAPQGVPGTEATTTEVESGRDHYDKATGADSPSPHGSGIHELSAERHHSTPALAVGGARAVTSAQAANLATLALAEAEAARTRPIRRQPEIVRVDARRCKVMADGDAVSYTQGGITRAISATFPCSPCWCECRPLDCDGSRQIVVSYADGERQTVQEIWP